MMESDGFGLNMCLYNNKTFLLVGFIPIRVVSLGFNTVNPVKYLLKSIVKFYMNH